MTKFQRQSNIAARNENVQFTILGQELTGLVVDIVRTEDNENIYEIKSNDALFFLKKFQFQFVAVTDAQRKSELEITKAFDEMDANMQDAEQDAKDYQTDAI